MKRMGSQQDSTRRGIGLFVLAQLMGNCAAPATDLAEPAPLPQPANATTPGARKNHSRDAWANAPSALRYAYVRSRQAEGADDPRFHVVREGDGLVARSPSRGVSARYAATGIEVSGEAGARGVLRTAGLRCDGVRVDARSEPFAIGASAHRVERRLGERGLDATEWAESGPLGIEQGFDVASGTACAELEVEIDVEGLAVSVDAEGARLTGESASLRYADVHAVDAEARVLPARLAARAGGLSLVVDTAGARFPVTVDPLVYVEDARVGSRASWTRRARASR